MRKFIIALAALAAAGLVAAPTTSAVAQDKVIIKKGDNGRHLGWRNHHAKKVVVIKKREHRNHAAIVIKSREHRHNHAAVVIKKKGSPRVTTGVSIKN